MKLAGKKEVSQYRIMKARKEEQRHRRRQENKEEFTDIPEQS